MMFQRITFICLLSLVIVSCASNGSRKMASGPYSPVMDEYIRNIQIDDKWLQYSHKDHGVVYDNDEEIRDVYSECTALAFGGREFKISNLTVTDPQVVYQVIKDYQFQAVETLMQQYSKTPMVLNERQKARKRAFKHWDNQEQLKTMYASKDARIQCLASNGWIVYEKKK